MKLSFNQKNQKKLKSTLKPIEVFVVRYDMSDMALSQSGYPVAFMSKTLQGSKSKYQIIEKEAMVLIEAVQKWSHYLLLHFILITDQRLVTFMFSNEKYTKIKTAKIQEWHLEFSSFNYTNIILTRRM